MSTPVMSCIDRLDAERRTALDALAQLYGLVDWTPRGLADHARAAIAAEQDLLAALRDVLGLEVTATRAEIIAASERRERDGLAQGARICELKEAASDRDRLAEENRKLRAGLHTMLDLIAQVASVTKTLARSET